MYLTLSPVRMDETLTPSRAGDVLILNGERFDFSALPEGAKLPAERISSPWFVGHVSRIDGELHLTLRLPHGPNPSRAVAFPDPIRVSVDGPIDLPFDPPAEPESQPDEEQPE
ncbi:hypothetical protein [Stutzerimonas nitrititolerans]|uniref:hypothetical protein n=1 Tax=Stutzerimonas nitrititolerans TaxID=2482751 RepID=UPI0028AEA15F|nr:hypothetical protein [Stutzerimonas nitrititolerans]